MKTDKMAYQSKNDLMRILGIDTKIYNANMLVANFLISQKGKTIYLMGCFKIEAFRLWLEANDIPYEDQRTKES